MYIDDDDNFLKMLDDVGVAKDDLRLPDGELGASIREAVEKEEKELIITVINAMGEEAVRPQICLKWLIMLIPRYEMSLFLQAISFKEAPKNQAA